jgi:hypothetical protein
VVDSAGIPAVVTTQLPPPKIDLSDRGWFKAHLAGADRHIGKTIVSRITGEVLFTYSRAIRNAEGMLEGVAQVSKTPQFFQQVSLTNELVSDVILAVWNHGGDVIARTGITPDQSGTTMPAASCSSACSMVQPALLKKHRRSTARTGSSPSGISTVGR